MIIIVLIFSLFFSIHSRVVIIAVRVIKLFDDKSNNFFEEFLKMGLSLPGMMKKIDLLVDGIHRKSLY